MPNKITIQLPSPELQRRIGAGVIFLVVLVLAFTVANLWSENQTLQQQVATLEHTIAGNNAPAASPTPSDTTNHVVDKPNNSIPPITSADHIDGNAHAPVFLVEYSDLECPFCKQLHGLLPSIQQQYGDKLGHVFRNFPLTIHANAKLEAQIAECVANVNGIRAVLRKDAFLPFVHAEQPDILCLQETKAQPGEAVIDLPEYKEYWNSADKKGYSGTAIFSKVTPMSVHYGLPAALQKKYDMTGDAYGNPNLEGRVLTAEYKEFYVVTVYTPNAKDDLSRIPLRHDHWDPAFLEYCQLLEKTKPVVFCGDLNVAHTELDLANPKPNRGKKGFTDEERAGFQAFVDAGFVDTLRLFKQGNGYYTWWSHFGGARERNVGWRIDYFLVSAALRDKVIAAEIYPAVMGSDHCPVSVTLNIA